MGALGVTGRPHCEPPEANGQKQTSRYNADPSNHTQIERLFANPDVLDLERTRNRHLAFGAGEHTCLGLSLARVQLRVVLKNLFAPKLAKADGVKRETNPALRGFATLPLMWT